MADRTALTAFSTAPFNRIHEDVLIDKDKIIMLRIVSSRDSLENDWDAIFLHAF